MVSNDGESSGAEVSASGPDASPGRSKVSVSVTPDRQIVEASESDSGAPSAVLDATVAEGLPPPKLEVLETGEYNPEKSRDTARARITYWLLSLLTILVVGSFAALFSLSVSPTFEHLKMLIEIMLGPIVALVSAATGFYFGANSAGKNNKQ